MMHDAIRAFFDEQGNIPTIEELTSLFPTLVVEDKSAGLFSIRRKDRKRTVLLNFSKERVVDIQIWTTAPHKEKKVFTPFAFYETKKTFMFYLFHGAKKLPELEKWDDFGTIFVLHNSFGNQKN